MTNTINAETITFDLCLHIIIILNDISKNTLKVCCIEFLEYEHAVDMLMCSLFARYHPNFESYLGLYTLKVCCIEFFEYKHL